MNHSLYLNELENSSVREKKAEAECETLKNDQRNYFFYCPVKNQSFNF